MNWIRKVGAMLGRQESGSGTGADPRWIKLQGKGIKCASCGILHKGMFDLGHHYPSQWRGVPKEQMDKNNALLEDFCMVDGEDFFIRCVLEIPIVGHDGERFGYGVWSSLSKSNFDLYSDTFKSGTQGELGPWFGWFSNALKGYPDTLGLKCDVHPQDGNQRPLLKLQPSDHPLAVEQHQGITIDRLFEIYEINGHRF